jgi:hypothetical protein
MTSAAGFVTLRAVLLYAGHGGGGLQLRLVVWNNNVSPSVLPFNYAGQVLLRLLPPPSPPPPTFVNAATQVVNDVPRGLAASEERDAAWDQDDDMG